MGQTMNPEKLKVILEKYTRPENCPGMWCKKINPEIWQQLNSKKSKADLQMFNINKQYSKPRWQFYKQHTPCMVITVCSRENPKVFSNLADAIALMAHAHNNISLARKEQIKSAIKQEYAAICALEDQTDSKLMFGNDLDKNLKEAKEASHISSSMRSGNHRT